MKVAVTGGTGFLGKPLVERLCGLGHQVRVLSRHPHAQRLPKGAEGVPFDGRLPPSEALAGVERVFHLAGEPIAGRFNAAHKQRVMQSRVESTRAIVEGARRAGTVKVLVSASAIGYYGPHGSEPLTESSPAGSDFLAQVCTAWERESHLGVNDSFRVVNPRIGVVLHPSGGALPKMLPPFKLGLGAVMGSGEQVLSWIHRDDAVSMLLALGLDWQLAGAVNVTAPNPVTQREFAFALGRALHRPVLMKAPSFALKLALGEMATLVLDGQKVLPVRAEEAGFQFRYPTLDQALAAMFAP